ncbi:hypothetical protein CYMTET_15005 [Cymbomonas tetramitiformis]|uniref:Uncharacterized protein n=1 Tax=Cymbomonas tetramitiformis TaxID=36881 RepID=A0AAE0GF83_9CHLO|nr:hypothetical protein CYMTET_15005 [Cymbomonas tetramitiformis]
MDKETTNWVPVDANRVVVVGSDPRVASGSGADPTSFDELHVLNTHDFTQEKIITSGEPPCPRVGHTITSVTINGAKFLLLLGGCSPHDADDQLRFNLRSQEIKECEVHLLQIGVWRWFEPCLTGTGPKLKQVWPHVSARALASPAVASLFPPSP